MSQGIRLKARVPAKLWDDVRSCADAAQCTCEDWTFAVCRDYIAGKFGVPKTENAEKGTRQNTITPWLRVPEGFDTSADNLRAALRAGVDHVKPLLTPLPTVEFRGFVILGRGCNFTVKRKDKAHAKDTAT
jgi:hypothetical protein